MSSEGMAQAGMGLNTKLVSYTAALRQKYLVNKKVLLIQTLQLQLDAFNRDVARNRGYYAYPPAGLQCLMKELVKRGVEVEILDLNYHFLKRIIGDDSFQPFDWLKIVDEFIEKFEPSIVGVTCIGVSTDWFKPTHPLTGVLRHVMLKDKQVVMAGGPVAVNEYRNYLQHELCHFIVDGEGEIKLHFLFDYLLGEIPCQTPTAGIYFKYEGVIEESHGEINRVTPEGNLVSTYGKIPIEDYNHVGSLNPFSRMAGQDRHFTGIQLNRGCRANCKFCGVPKFMGRGVRQFPEQDLYKELVYLITERGVLHFELLDDDFLGPSDLRSGVMELLTMMCALRKQYGITWAAGNGLIAASINEELARLIHDSGCIGFRIGIESGNEEMLKRMRKPATKKALRHFADIFRNYPRIFIGGNYILGLFGEETFEQMLDTYNFACEINLDWASFSVYQFASKATSRVEYLKDDGRASTEFVPSKDISDREVRVEKGIKLGLEIFNVPKDYVPSREQIKEIWFVFNLLSNYIHNKNLRPGGNPEKLVSWLKAIQLTYPKNPYMPLFTGLGYVLLNDRMLAREELNKARVNLRDSRYWRDRFEQFKLMNLIHNFPDAASEVYQALELSIQYLKVEMECRV